MLAPGIGTSIRHSESATTPFSESVRLERTAATPPLCASTSSLTPRLQVAASAPATPTGSGALSLPPNFASVVQQGRGARLPQANAGPMHPPAAAAAAGGYRQAPLSFAAAAAAMSQPQHQRMTQPVALRRGPGMPGSSALPRSHSTNSVQSVEAMRGGVLASPLGPFLGQAEVLSREEWAQQAQMQVLLRYMQQQQQQIALRDAVASATAAAAAAAAAATTPGTRH